VFVVRGHGRSEPGEQHHRDGDHHDELEEPDSQR
jgi:hypothetical protein